jgi:hypothetical protein
MRRFQVAITFDALGRSCLGTHITDLRGLVVALRAHSHMAVPALFMMSAQVVTPRNNCTRWMCTRSIFLIPGTFAASSIMKLSPVCWRCIHVFSSRSMLLLIPSRNSQVCDVFYGLIYCLTFLPALLITGHVVPACTCR